MFDAGTKVLAPLVPGRNGRAESGPLLGTVIYFLLREFPHRLVRFLQEVLATTPPYPTHWATASLVTLWHE